MSRVLDLGHEIQVRGTRPIRNTFGFPPSALSQRSKRLVDYARSQRYQTVASFDGIRTEKKDLSGLNSSAFDRLVLRHLASILPIQR